MVKTRHNHRPGGPRPVVIGTVIAGFAAANTPLPVRVVEVVRLLKDLSTAAARQYPGRRLDLAVLPEAMIQRPGTTARERAVALDHPALAPLRRQIRRLETYAVVPMILDDGATISNAAVLYDRTGAVAGVYRKVHPVAPLGSDVLEDGITPGRDFPVFACDFGRIGVQICWDMTYPDGWAALARQGAELVAVPSASPQTLRPAAYASLHRYYVVTSTPRDNATIYDPVGRAVARITAPGALVRALDLDYAVVHWSERNTGGQALPRRFGARVGGTYSTTEDTGVFWSNDPAMPIRAMLAELGLADLRAEAKRIGRLQAAARRRPRRAQANR